ncbi:hypothetical protein Tco_0004518 [Tanacetum coccineum]
MSWFSRCSWCGGPFNGGNYRCCTNVSFGDEFVCNPDPILNEETPDFSYPPSQPQTSSLDQLSCFHCGDPLEDGVRDGNSSIDALNSNSFNDPPNVFTHPPQPQYESYSCELYGNDAHYGYDCPPRYPIDHQEDLNQQRISDVHVRWDKIKESQNELLNMMQSFCEMASTIPLNDNTSQIPPSIAITLVLPIKDSKDSLSMGDEHLSTIPEKESDEFIKFSVEDLVPIPSDFEDTSESDSDSDLPSCDDFSLINVSEKKSVNFSNPLFDSNDDFTSSDDESLSDEDILEDKVKIYSNPLFEFDDEYISSDVSPLFDEVLDNIESKDFYDEPDLLVTPLSAFNEDECFDPGGDIDEIDTFLDINVSMNIEDDYYDSEGDIIYLESLLIKDTTPNLPPNVFLDYDPRSLKDEPDDDDLMTEDKVFDPRIPEKNFSPTYVSLPFEDRHYLSLTYVIRIFFFISPIRWILLFFSTPGVRILFLTLASPLFIL